jgi:uncharacterized damage-inducible protein DinB
VKLEVNMSIREMLLSELDQEMENTRKMLERVPLDKADWKPHEKSMMLGRLAGHIAELPSMGARVVKMDIFDLASMMTGGHQPYVAKSSDDLLRTFDRNVAEFREALAGTSDQHLNQVWSMQLNGKTLASGHRLPMIRSIFMNHIIHHRAQLGVYLRLNHIPLPALYGPSADEGRLS